MPHAERSANQLDYQDLAPAVVVMSKSFAAGSFISPHSHRRDQLLYAVRGTMRIRTGSASWIVPPDRALYLPAGTEHSVQNRHQLEMRTLYIAPGSHPLLPRAPVALEVGELLRALILTLLIEPMSYDQAGRGGHVAWLILDEIVHGHALSIEIPMPTDVRLARACDRILEDPACPATLDLLAEQSGASVRTLARLFQRQCGMSFTAWRQRARFVNALEALSRGRPVSEIARDNGYASASAFTAAFRRRFGHAPRVLAGGRQSDQTV